MKKRVTDDDQEQAMRASELNDIPCSVSRTLGLIGDKWTMMILRECFMGKRRFEEFEGNLGISRHILSQRLKKLVDNGVLRKQPYGERGRRMEYKLTEKGFDIYPVIVTMLAFGDKWEADEGAPLDLMHLPRNKDVMPHRSKPQLICSECGEPLDARDVRPTLGAAMCRHFEQLGPEGFDEKIPYYKGVRPASNDKS